MPARSAVVVTLAAVLGVACVASPSSGADESEVRAGELATALSGHAIDPAEVLGTFDAQPSEGTPPPEHARFIFMRDGTAVACPNPAACRPIDPATPRRPFELHEARDHRAHYVILRTSAADATLFRVYAVEHASAEDATRDATWRFRELTQPGPRPFVSMTRRACSETMYDERDADHACAFYQCRLDHAPSVADRCSYLSDFGLPYCKKYFETDFHDHAFGPRVRQCLQEAMRDGMDGLACGALHTAAIRSHVECYVASGYCALSLSDRFRIARAIEPKDLTLEIGQTLAHIEKACSGLPNHDDD